MDILDGIVKLADNFDGNLGQILENSWYGQLS
jgi:hypothetical protein